MYGDLGELLTFFVYAVGGFFGICMLIGVIAWVAMYLVQFFKDVSST